MIRKKMTFGVPQGSVIGPLLWNITFDNNLKEEVPPGVSIICYTDNTLVVTAEDDIPMFEWKVNTTLEPMTRWIEPARLRLAATKTEAMLFTRYHRFSPPFLNQKYILEEIGSFNS